MLTELLPGQRGRSHNGPEAAADWGSDGDYGGSSCDDKGLVPGRNGGMRYFREIDMADREERWSAGVDKLKYAWRTITGPAPEVKRGDREAARWYLKRLYSAEEHGGWTSSEASGLSLAIKLWKKRAAGEDPRFDEVGNRKGGLTKEESAAIEMRRIILNMKQALERSARGEGCDCE